MPVLQKKFGSQSRNSMVSLHILTVYVLLLTCFAYAIYICYTYIYMYIYIGRFVLCIVRYFLIIFIYLSLSLRVLRDLRRCQDTAGSCDSLGLGKWKSEATSRVMQRLEGVGFMTVRVHGALYTPCQNIVAKI